MRVCDAFASCDEVGSHNIGETDGLRLELDIAGGDNSNEPPSQFTSICSIMSARGSGGAFALLHRTTDPRFRFLSRRVHLHTRAAVNAVLCATMTTVDGGWLSLGPCVVGSALSCEGFRTSIVKHYEGRCV
jgi:hypothetical protein